MASEVASNPLTVTLEVRGLMVDLRVKVVADHLSLRSTADVPDRAKASDGCRGRFDNPLSTDA